MRGREVRRIGTVEGRMSGPQPLQFGDEVVETLVAALEGRTGGAVVVRAAADAQADGETTLAEHVEGGVDGGACA